VKDEGNSLVVENIKSLTRIDDIMCGDKEVITLHTVVIICFALLGRCSH